MVEERNLVTRPRMNRRGTVEVDEVVPRRIQRMVDGRRGGPSVTIGGSPPANLPGHVLRAAVEATGRHGYADALGEPDLRDALAAKLRIEGIPATADQILVTNGAMQALDITFRTILAPGDGVVMPLPGFFIGGLVERAGGVLQGLGSPAANGYRPDWEAGFRTANDRTTTLFVNSPVNPTGYVYQDADLERAARLASERELWVVSDESHSHFLYRGERHRSICSLPGLSERTILIRSFSKDFAMPGWRLGYALMPPRLASAMRNTFEWSSLCVNRVSQAAGHAALTGPQGWIRQFVAEAEARSQWVVDGINAMPGLHCVLPGGGLNLLVTFDGPVTELVNRLILDAGVPVHPGEAFGGSGCFRLQLGATDESLRQALDSMSRITTELHDA